MVKSDNMMSIAEEIIERSASVAMRSVDSRGRSRVDFISRNISMYGYDRGQFHSGELDWMGIIHPEDLEDLVTLITGFEEMGNDSYSIVYRILKADGEPVWITDHSHVCRDESGTVLHTDSIISDYTETRENLERIGENLRMQAVLNEILEGLHNSDLERSIHIILETSGSYLELDRVVLFRNTPDNSGVTAAQEWCGPGISPLSGSEEYRIDYDTELPGLAADLAASGFCLINHGEAPPRWAGALENAGVNATALYSITLGDEVYGFLSFQQCRPGRVWNRETARFLENVSRLVAPAIFRQRNEQTIQSLALTDQLTGLHNRHHLDTRLAQAVEKARATGYSGYVVFIDLDDFKIINDAYGHDYGDAILCEIASFLKSHFGGQENVFRSGGDEFVILIEPAPATDVPDVYSVMSGLLQRAQLPWEVSDRIFYCTLSIGVVRFPEGDENGREIIKNADIALYQAKKLGKNNYVFYTNSLDNDSAVRAEMESAMRASIKNGFEGFEVYFQPLVDANGRMIGAEALVRWAIAGKRLSPDQFIPLAEYLGLIVPIGEYMLRSSLRICSRINKAAPDFFVSVNVSMRQFKQPEFLDSVTAILEDEGVDCGNVMLEITEGMAVHDMARMKQLAGALQEKGIRVAMDDFGTGYSSLANMRDLPVDVVKIDRSFISDVTTDAYSQGFVRFITDLIHSMGRKICVEGVETEGQLRYCQACGADYMQGFHLWRPMPVADLVELIESREAVTGGKSINQIDLPA